MSISDSCNEGSDIEIEKISHSTALEQCRLLLQYVDQLDPSKFVEEQDMPRLQSLLRRIQSNIYQARQQKKLTDFYFHNS